VPIIPDSEYDLEAKDLGQAMPESHDDVTDEPSLSKKARLGSRGKR
jgi:hypothetical protein